MSGDHDSGDRDATQSRVSLFGRRKKPAPADAPPPEKPPRKPRRMGVSSLSGLLTFVLLGALGTVGALAWLMKEARSPGPLAEDKVVMITRDDDASSIADQLERAGVVDSAMWFNILTLLDGNRGALKRGEYAFKAGMSMNDVENELIAHRVVRYKLTIPEGLTSQQIVDRLRDDSILVGDIREIPREGALMPDTYYFERGDTRLSILSRMAKTQTKTVDEVWKARSPNLPIKSPWEMVTLASIVEKETGKPDERPRVAGVFINRLGKRMRLDSDPTIVYGLVMGKGTLGRSITRADLNQSTPYNTYIIDGLPPGPICNPGKAALEAVAKPAQSKDLYFVADGTGGHAFAETLDQHQKNVARWRQIEKDVKDKLAPDVAPQAGPAIRGFLEQKSDPAQFGALVAPGQGQAPASVFARLSEIGADRNSNAAASAAAMASAAAPRASGLKSVPESNDAPAAAPLAYGDGATPKLSQEPFGALVTPTQGEAAPAAIVTRLSKIGADRNSNTKASAADMTSAASPGASSLKSVPESNDAPAATLAYGDGATPKLSQEPFGALVTPTQGQAAPTAIVTRLSKIGADRKAKDAALAMLAAPGFKTLEESAVVSGVNDAPAEGLAFGDADPPGTSGPVATAPLSPAMLADQKAREAKYGTATLASTEVPASFAAAPAAAQPATASGRPRIYDASEGTPLDPLLNKTYDLSYAKVVPASLIK